MNFKFDTQNDADTDFQTRSGFARTNVLRKHTIFRYSD